MLFQFTRRTMEGPLSRRPSPHLLLITSILVACLAVSGPAPAGEEEENEDEKVIEIESLQELGTVQVREKRPITAASDEVVRDRDFLNFPRQSPSDLLRIVPGIFINQHTGGGKAHQIFLRGFDAEHGQDLAGYLDGIPLNETSQIHGQGYLDLHFLIPESLDRIRLIKGPYLPEYGNFAVAGAIDFLPRASVPADGVTLTYGSFDTFRGLGQIAGDLDGKLIYFAAQGDRSDGFTNPGDLWGARGLFSLLLPVGERGGLRVLTGHYHSEFDAADAVPTAYDYRARPDVGRFGSVDPTDGGESVRHLVGLSYTWEEGGRKFDLLGYYNYRKAVLYTNYTYYLLNPSPDRGDQYELWEQRHYGGLRASFELPASLGGLSLQTRIGLDTRLDGVRQKQSNSHERDVFNRLTDYNFLEANLGAYLKETLIVNKYVQFMAGLRLDSVLYDVEGTQDLDYRNICTNRAEILEDVPVSAETYQWGLSPKASVVITPFEKPRGPVNSLDLFLNYGEGFYTTRAPLMANMKAPDISAYPEAPCVAWSIPYRGIDHDIPKARAAEAAFRLYLWEGKASLSASVWWADKEQELVFEPESGISTPRGESRRIGQEVELRLQPLDWLYLGTDFFHTSAEFREKQDGMSSDEIPGTPELIVQNMVSVRHRSGFHGSLRGRYVGERPLPQPLPYPTLHSRDYYVVDLLAGYDGSWWSAEIAVDNLFDTDWDDTSFAYPSRPEPGSASPVYYGKHITPGTPFAVRASVGIRF